MDNQKLDRFRNLRFEDFERMALDKSLKPYEKIGFPSIFREGYDNEIFNDIQSKTNWASASSFIDIGCGCGELTNLILKDIEQRTKQITLIDSKSVLDQLITANGVNKVAGKFPDNFEEVLQFGYADVIVCYSVFHYVFLESNPITFIERALALLNPGGRFLLGDIPNVSKRNRFLSSPAGVAFHKKLMNTNESPKINAFSYEQDKIDDGYLAGIMSRYRNFGYEVYLLPQSSDLPLATSREDLLFVKPH